ncbi:MAG: bifunctional folylpolyglutamate synthase/dihydrofolate synthase [Syntrophorhabdaceae bacterium]
MNDAAYEDSLKYLYGLEKFGSVFGLENISRLLRSIDNPHDSFKTIHIAGTNGKGSVAAIIAAILKEAGYKVGKYTSPHLVSFTERITVNDLEITQKELAALTNMMRRKIKPGQFYSFFDFTTAIAFEYFKRKKVDIAVIETGLGGRLDSTNVLKPLVGIITNISFDHMKELGRTLTEIAGEKAGIIKERVPVITGARGKSLAILKKTAEDRESPIYVLGEDFRFRKMSEKHFSYKGLAGSYKNLNLILNGDHQLSNAALALGAIEIIAGSGFNATEDHIRSALSSVVWQGRLEMVREKPVVILDGAHNVSGVRALKKFVCSHYRHHRKVMVFGVMRDKQYREMLKTMNGCVDCAIFTQPETDRALEAVRMKNLAHDSIVTTDTASALRRARQITTDDDLILVTGSLYTIGEAKRAINEIF